MLNKTKFIKINADSIKMFSFNKKKTQRKFWANLLSADVGNEDEVDLIFKEINLHIEKAKNLSHVKKLKQPSHVITDHMQDEELFGR